MMYRPLAFTQEVAGWLHNHDAPIIVTGVSGWLGRAALEMLDHALDDEMGDALERRVRAFSSKPGVVNLRSGRLLRTHDYAGLADFSTRPGLVLHFAFRTRGYAAESDYVARNRAIAQSLRRFIDRNGALGLFIPSSGAVYEAGFPLGQPRVLCVDIEKNPYGVVKLEDEAMFAAQAAQLGFAFCGLRIFNLGGPFINNLSDYALASIIADVRQGGAINLRAARPIWRSYAHVQDVLNIAMAVLTRKLEVPVCDTAGTQPVEIGELAGLVSEWLIGRRAEIIRPDWLDGVADEYLGDLAGFQRLAQQAGVELQDLQTQVQDTAAYIASLG